jgi:RHS repeat-associated protein
LTDFVGAIVELYSFDAYGNAIGFDPSVALTEFLYSGEQFDSKIGQQYLRQRYYDPTTGRFNRLDPFFGNLNAPQSLHKYLYTHADPVNGIDPNGLENSISVSISTAISNGISALNNVSLSAYVSVYSWSVGAPVTFRLIQYGMASLSVVSTLTSPDPAMDFLLGPVGVIDDLVSIGNGLKGISQMLAKSPKFVNLTGGVYKGLALLKEPDYLNRAQGVVARILPENVNTSLGSIPSINPAGWSDLVKITMPTDRARGHLLARWFGGAGNDTANLVPLHKAANEKMRSLVETPIANSLTGSNAKYTEVVYSVTPHYNGNDLIPDYIEIKAIGLDNNDIDHVIFDGKIFNQP